MIRAAARQLPVLVAVLFVASVDNQILIPLLPDLAFELAAPIERLGLLLSLYAAAAAGTNLFLGPLLDRWGRLHFFRAGLVLLALAAAVAAEAQTLPLLVLARGLAGAAGGILATAVTTQVGDTFPYSARGRAMGIVLTAYFGALILGIPVGSAIADLGSWRWTFRLEALLSLLLLLATKRLIPVQGDGTQPILGPLRRLWERPAAAWPLLVSFCISGGTLAFLSFIGAFLRERFALSAAEISLVFLVSGVAALAASPLSGVWSDRWTKRRVFLVANTLLVVPFCALPHLKSPGFLFAVVFVAGVLIATRQTALQALQSEVLESSARGTYLALRNTFSQAGIAVGVAAASVILPEYGYAGVVWLAATATALGSVILWLRRPPLAGE
ncbi:MAG: MFS transporter [Acidobacteriota bacterium]